MQERGDNEERWERRGGEGGDTMSGTEVKKTSERREVEEEASERRDETENRREETRIVIIPRGNRRGRGRARGQSITRMKLQVLKNIVDIINTM
ncbi:hypothetical protein JTB14_004877 [Gonioctena quinquepunctata]|nr:hypothetical protein JTB14_004877 [Gonioctena quinquepunctata]